MANLSTLLELRDDVLYWQYREPDSLPVRYAKTCHLFNSKYAGQPVQGDTFICCGEEHNTAEVIALLREVKDARIRRARPAED